MSPYEILVADGLSENGLALLRSAGRVTVDPTITAGELLAAIPRADALIVRSRTEVTAGVIEAGTRLRVIGRAGVGVDNIDVAAAAARGITVVNSPPAVSVAVAELTVGLMLALARQIPAADVSLKQGRWDKNALMGSELAGKTLGLLGMGRIGGHAASFALALGMSVLAHDPGLTREQIRDRGAQPASFEEVLARADYVSLHLPLTPGTRHLIGARQLAMMKHGARLISTARGGLIDEDALRDALDSGALAGAALDVFEEEPPPPGGIATHPKVIASPHIGAQTVEAQARTGVTIAEEVLAVLRGAEPRWRVLPEQRVDER